MLLFGFSNLCCLNLRLRAIGMLQTVGSQREVTNIFNVSMSVISRQWNRYQTYPKYSGRPMATAGVQDRFICNQGLRNRSQTANQIVANLHQATGVRVKGQTIRNRLHAAHHEKKNRHARQPWIVPTMTNRHIAHRCEWCREC